MPTFSKQSLEKLYTCDKRLQDVCNEAIKHYDFRVICGYRGKAEQDQAVKMKVSNAPWPTSRHNSSPSQAVDLAPFPIDWNDISRFNELSKHMFAAAEKLGVKIRWGGLFTKLKDFPHYELE